MAEGRALARAALVGNPSDVYGGAVLGLTIPQLAAQVRVSSGGGSPATAVTAAELVDATLARFVRAFPEAALDQAGTRVEVETTIPRSVGLGGSSAIVIALLRALCEHHGAELAPTELAELALSIERDDLGVTAGLQDRVTQAYEGLVFMDFAAGAYERLERSWLPPLLVAWRAHTAAPSGQVHSSLLERWQAGEPVVRSCIERLTALAHRAREAVACGDHDTLRRCVDGSYDARARMLTLDPAHVEMVEIARAAGAAVNYAGSGGAIVCVCDGEPQRRDVAQALERAGCGTVAPD